VTLEGNEAFKNGGAEYCNDNASITFDRNCLIKFIGNRAEYGGGLYASHNSNISFHRNTCNV